MTLENPTVTLEDPIYGQDDPSMVRRTHVWSA